MALWSRRQARTIRRQDEKPVAVAGTEPREADNDPFTLS
jgi:hypothetical protein